MSEGGTLPLTYGASEAPRIILLDVVTDMRLNGGGGDDEDEGSMALHLLLDENCSEDARRE
jgi:hypothetical protein